MKDIGALVRSANPVPGEPTTLNDAELDALLHLIEARNGDMDLEEMTTPIEPPKAPFRHWLVAAAAFSAVLIIGVALLLTRVAGDETPPAAPADTSAAPATIAPPATDAQESATADETILSDELVALAAAYEQAFNAGDAEAMSSLLSEGFGPYQPGFLDDLTMSREEFMAFHRTVYLRESKLSIERCIATEFGMRCDFEYAGPVEIALYGAPWQESNALYVEDGEITRIESRVVMWPNTTVYDDAIAWVETVSPEDGARMDWPLPGTDEDAALWLEYAPRWAEAGRP